MNSLFMTNLQTNLMKKGVQVVVPLDLLKESSDAAILGTRAFLGMRTSWCPDSTFIEWELYFLFFFLFSFF
jgi:hypothetical protein